METNRVKHLLLLLLFGTVGVYAYAQKGAKISGTVFSETEGPLIMASITERDEENRIIETAQTDFEGNFSMEVKNTRHRLRVSYTGYRTLLLPIDSRRVFNIEMTKMMPHGEDVVTNHKKDAKKEQITNSKFLYSMDSTFLIALVIIAAVVILSVFFHYVPFVLWLSAKVSGVNISLIQLFLMRIRNVPPYTIVQAMIEAHKAGLENITRDSLEAHYLAGGHVEKVVHALVSAAKANIELSFQMATAIDLAGRDVFEAVQMSVNPKVIDTPHVTAVAKDGIQLIAIARVTVRANIKRLVGGAGEDTVLARVGEGIVSSIGSSENHKAVLENPDSISKLVLKKGLDAGTAFEILSIDIADIDIGKNIGAALQIDQANADKNIAQAKAEERRAMAVALEQEMKARAQEARAHVIEAEAEVPKAMAEAFRSGNLGIMDYYRMKNIQADTAMRDNIAKD